MSHEIETEFKLRALRPIEVAAVDAAIREAGFTCRHRDEHRHIDTYLDDARGSLATAGIGLRIRDDRHNQRITCKARGQRGGGLFVRTEVDEAWTSAITPPTAHHLPPSLCAAVEPFTVDRPLVPTMRLETKRDTRMLQRDGLDLCTVMIDRVSAHVPGRTATFAEVEIEVIDDLPGCEKLVATLGRHLPLQPADDDKPTHAAALLGLQRTSPRPPAVCAEAPTGASVAAIAARHLAELRHAEVAMRTFADPSHVHAMRTAARRLRCLVRAFRAVWPGDTSAQILDHLGETSRQLGSLRDLDVMLTDLPGQVAALPPGLRDAGTRVVAWVMAQRTAEQDRVHTWLRCPARLASARELDERLATVDSEGRLAAEPLAVTVPIRIGKAAATLRRLAAALPSDLPFQPTHTVRIASKRLRYLAEEFADLPGHDFAKSLRAVTRLQRDLGTVCDHEVAAARLLDWVPAAAASAPATAMVAAALGGLAVQHAKAARKARKRGRVTLADVLRKKVWRRFADRQSADAILPA